MKNGRPFTKWIVASLIIISILIIMGMQLAMFLITLEWSSQMGGQFLALILVTPVFFILQAFLFYIFARLTRLINQLSKQMRKIAQGDYSARLILKGAGPLKETYRDFNKMAQELEGVSSLRNDFINEFSHEFRTPITSINGFAKILEDETLTGEQEKLYTGIIIKESERLKNLSSSVLTLTSLEKQQIVTDVSNFPLDQQLQQSVIAFYPQLEKKKIEVTVNLKKATVASNKDLIQHIWTNILNNCLKFTPAGGKITVTNKVEADKNIVTITNSGPNLTDKEKDQIFNKFYHSKDNQEGIGMGLAIVKRVLELINGEITVENLPVTGVKFVVTI